MGAGSGVAPEVDPDERMDAAGDDKRKPGAGVGMGVATRECN